MPAIDLQDATAEPLKEGAVMRYEQQRAGILQQELLQPQNGLQVQVVGRFVQKQQIRLAYQRPRQQHAALHSGGEMLEQVLPRQAHPGQHRDNVLMHRPCRVGLQNVLQGVQFFEVSRIRMQLELAMDLVVLRQGRAHLAQSPSHHVIDAAMQFVRDFLRQTGHTQARHAGHLAAFNGHLTPEQFQKRALAGTVPTHQRNPLTRLDLQVDAFEHRLAAVADTDIMKSD